MITQNGDLIINCKVCYDLFDYDLIKYVSPNIDASTVHVSTNGYNYFDIDGLTVTFFSPVKSDELIYHIVICMLSYDELDKYGLTYSELMAAQYTLTFDLCDVIDTSTELLINSSTNNSTNNSTNSSTELLINSSTNNSTERLINTYDVTLSVD